MPVDSQHADFSAALARWERARDAAAGQDAVHAKGARYLPKLAEQTDTEYDGYKCRALYYNATGRTVDGLTGLVFRREPAVEIPDALDYLREDIDTCGTPLLAFSEKVVDELLTVGRLGLLVDYPPLQTARTQAEEKAAGGRPYIKTYCAESIINWRVQRVGNRNMLTLAVLKEQAEERDDDYTVKMADTWRVLRLADGVYTQELWRKNPNKQDEFILVDGYPVTPLMGGKPMDFIPLLICGPMGVDACVQKPPILDLADVNISHYRTTADYEHGLHFTGLPTPIVTGHQFSDGETFALGSTTVKGFPNPDARATFLEFQGTGLTQLSKRLDEKEAMMAALGARMLAAEKRAAEAAETAAIHRAGENSVLGSLANAASAAISKALNWCLQWAGVQAEAKVELNTDYLPTGLSAQEVTALVAAWQAGAISHRTLHDNLLRGEVARQGVDFDEEKSEIESEGPKLGAMEDPAAGGSGGA
jgi:hypothetical protein